MFDERLTDEDWSPYLAKAAGRGRQRARELAMRRRSELGRFVKAPQPVVHRVGEVFETRSGALAYVKRMPNTIALSTFFKTQKNDHTDVSLAWVSILG
jgi:hypothetical protein